MNIFRRHKQRIQAEGLAAKAGGAPITDDISGGIYEQMSAQLRAHKIELKSIESRQTKAKRKGVFLETYTAYVDGILAADEAVQDDVVMTVFVWALDAGRFDVALPISFWAIKHDIAPPPDFKRSVPTILAEEVAEYALARTDTISQFDDVISEVLETLDDQDIADPVRSKLYKAAGLAIFDTDAESALEFLQDALMLNPKIGVKKQIASLEKRIASEKDKTGSPTPLTPETGQANANLAQSESGGEDGGEGTGQSDDVHS